MREEIIQMMREVVSQNERKQKRRGVSSEGLRER